MNNDCDNVMVRDALPELAAGAIAAADAAAIRAHVDDCESCRAELLLIQTVRDRSGRVRSVDVAAIVRALPTPPQKSAPVVDIATRRKVRAFPMQWRAAAAALVVAAGTIGVAVTRDGGSVSRSTPVAPVSVAVAPASTPPVASTESVVVASTVAPPRATAAASTGAPVAKPTPAPAPALLVAGATHDLQTAEQAQLLKELEAYDGSVLEDPETARYDFQGAGL